MKTNSNRREGRFKVGGAGLGHRAPAILCGVASLSLSAGWCIQARSAELEKAGGKDQDFTQMSLEELGTVKVTSVSKRSEDLSSVAAAVTVIGQDDLRRSGVTTIPEALRMAPGVQVGRINPHEWAVSVRGFNDVYAQKLLVLMDGRSIYSPFFSGTMWMTQDTMLEDLDRIEVVRGPGGTMWGANAVNGVINMVSKSSKDTQGLLLNVGTGSEQLGAASVRYGGKVGDDLYYRIYGKYDQWDEYDIDGTSTGANDGWWKGQGGLRLDWEPHQGSALMLQAGGFTVDADHGFSELSLSAPYNSIQQSHWRQYGGFVLGRWTRTFSEESELTVQSFVDRQVIGTTLLDATIDIADLDLQQRFDLGDRNTLMLGGGGRFTQMSMDSTAQVQVDESVSSHDVENFFIQDEFRFLPERLHLTVGSKVEHNDFTGWEVQPSARLAWMLNEKNTFWAAVARAVRTPSEIEQHGRVNIGVVPPNPPFSPLPSYLTVRGHSDYGSEKLVAYELGYRFKASHRVSLDLAGFMNRYDGLRGNQTSLDLSGLPNYTTILNTVGNVVEGWTYGVELGTAYQATDWWGLHADVTFTDSGLDAPANALTGAPQDAGFATPQFQASLRSSWDLGKQIELDGWLRYVDAIPSAGTSIPGVTTGDGSVAAYVTADVRLAWHPKQNVEVSITGQNLLDSAHREFNPTFTSTRYTEVPRSVFAKISLRF